MEERGIECKCFMADTEKYPKLLKRGRYRLLHTESQ